MHRVKVNWILEADIMSFFDSLDRTQLMFDEALEVIEARKIGRAEKEEA